MKQLSNQGCAGTYIDLFSGCGGLSLGLGNAGWKGIFAVEKDAMAFETFKHNMVARGSRYQHFEWVDWLPQKATTIQTLLKNYTVQLASLRGTVDLIAGGPPCQGFSMAGLRDSKDPRNKMSKEYIKMVDIIRPKFLLLENVRGFNAAFKNGSGRASKIAYSQIVTEALEKLGYRIFKDYVHSQHFGVPQERTRFIMVGIRSDLLPEGKELDVFGILQSSRTKFLEKLGLPLRDITVKEAIGDLETQTRHSRLVDYVASRPYGYKCLDYCPPEKANPYIALMRGRIGDAAPCSLRLANHKDTTIDKFKYIQKISRPGINLSQKERNLIGTKKQAISVLDPNRPSRTITTLPDDVIHYSEPRILCVRENARIQSFPDDFEFQGKYTTGGANRKKECPRYTQVGNAVPPLLGQALGFLIKDIKCSLK